MGALMIYNSIHHGNTERIAKKIASVLKAELVKPKEIVNRGILEKYNLMGFGSGIYFGKHHGSLLDFVDKMPKMKNKKAFIFSTSGAEEGTFNEFNEDLSKKLLDKGFEIIGEFSCRGFDTFGPFKLIGGLNKGRPDKRDLKDAEKFAKSLKKKM
jgi:flavodoxin